MRFFGLFGKRRRTIGEVPKAGSDATVTDALTQLTSDLERLNGRFNTVDIALKRHDDQLAAHEILLQEQTRTLQTLEHRIAAPPASPMTFRQLGRQQEHPGSHICPGTARPNPSQQFDIGQFTEQQKRLLAVFFQNKGRRMSYADVAALMNKSACTIKNQMNQIRQKADLFECSIGSQSRNLFKLKDDLRVEKYLKVGQPAERFEAVEGTDSSAPEEADHLVEYAYVRASPERDGDERHGDQPPDEE